MGGHSLRNSLLVAVLVGVPALFVLVLEDAALSRADLVVANGPDPRSLDPAVTTAIADARILSSLFEGLLDTDPETLEPVPALAREQPEVSADGLRWTFRLRRGLRWSDGHPLDAHGLRWSFLRFLDPRTAARFPSLLFGVEGARAFNQSGTGRESVGIRAPDPETLVFTLEQRQPYFPAILTLFPLYPVPRHAVERHGALWMKPDRMVCNGPYKPVLWRLRDRVRVERNPLYRANHEVALDSIDWLSTESAATQLNLYVRGDCDIITDIPTSAVNTLLARYGPDATGEFQPTARLGTFYFKVNTDRPPINNPKLRRALSLSVDRVAIVENVTRAGEAPAFSFVPPGTRCGAVQYEPPRDTCRFDPELARELLRQGLAEEGVRLADLPVFEVLYSPDVNDQAIAEVLQAQWARLGLRCRLVNMDSGSIRGAIRKQDYTIARSSWIGDFNDPSNFLDLFILDRNGSDTGFKEPRYTELVMSRANAAGESGERSRVLREAEALLLESAAIIPVFHYVSRGMVKPWVRGYHRNVLDWHPPRWLRVTR